MPTSHEYKLNTTKKMMNYSTQISEYKFQYILNLATETKLSFELFIGVSRHW